MASVTQLVEIGPWWPLTLQPRLRGDVRYNVLRKLTKPIWRTKNVVGEGPAVSAAKDEIRRVALTGRGMA